MGMDLLHCVHSGRASATHLIHASIIWSAAAPLDSFEITAHIRRERRMWEQPAEVARRSRIRRGEIVAEQKGKPRSLQSGSPGALIVEQAQFGNEADVRERDIVADQEGALRQRLLDARQIGCEAVLRAVIELARDGSVA